MQEKNDRTNSHFSIGVDFGTNSVRAILADLLDGREIAVSVYRYPTGTDGVILDPADPNLARQSPSDYIEGFISTVVGVVREASVCEPTFTPAAVGTLMPELIAIRQEARHAAR